MADMRAQIQLARIQDDAWLWGTLVARLMEADFPEGMKAALSGVARGSPGGAVKRRAGELIVGNLQLFAESDVREAMDAAVTAAIYSAPDSETRARATEFVVTNLERLAGIDSKLAADNSRFALSWTKPGSKLEREAATIWSRLKVQQPGRERETAYSESMLFDESPCSSGVRSA